MLVRALAVIRASGHAQSVEDVVSLFESAWRRWFTMPWDSINSTIMWLDLHAALSCLYGKWDCMANGIVWEVKLYGNGNSQGIRGPHLFNASKHGDQGSGCYRTALILRASNLSAMVNPGKAVYDAAKAAL